MEMVPVCALTDRNEIFWPILLPMNVVDTQLPLADMRMGECTGIPIPAVNRPGLGYRNGNDGKKTDERADVRKILK